MTQATDSGTIVTAAQVRWQGSQCFSQDSGDRYFSPDADAEVRRVFMAPANMLARFKAAQHTLTCGELGFGTGLNVAVLAEEFCKHADTSAQLHIISLERTPLGIADMRDMARRWAATLPVFQELADNYPPLLKGWHRLHLCGGRVRLSLYFGDAMAGLGDIIDRQRRPVDHWLLDGFAPPKNPSMWQDKLFGQLAALSNPGTTIATYTAVGAVRRALQQHGFAMRKVNQMPIKLHSLAGEFAGSNMADWQAPQRINVLGGGIAGACVARALADRGAAVQLIQPDGRLARHASRIPAAALHGRLRDDASAGAAWQVLSYHYSHRRLQAFAGYRATGVLQVSGPNASPERLAALLERYGGSGDWLAACREETPGAGITRWNQAAEGLQFSIGGVVRGPAIVRALTNHPLISLQQVAQPADVTVLANGLLARDNPAARYLEMAPLKGQAELCSHANPPNQPIVGAGYMAPCPGGMVVGSSYEYRDWVPADARKANLARWRDTGVHRGAFRGSRTITSDRVAIIGELYDRDGASAAGLRICTGFGSTGMSSAPLAGECIAAELQGEFAPITRDLVAAVSSERFRSRQARRGLRMGAEH